MKMRETVLKLMKSKMKMGFGFCIYQKQKLPTGQKYL